MRYIVTRTDDTNKFVSKSTVEPYIKVTTQSVKCSKLSKGGGRLQELRPYGVKSLPH